MVRAAPFAVLSLGRLDGNTQSGNGKPVERLRADRQMADLALAFALDIDLAEAEEEKWPMGRTLTFTLLTSVALWVLIASLITIIT